MSAPIIAWTHADSGAFEEALAGVAEPVMISWGRARARLAAADLDLVAQVMVQPERIAVAIIERADVLERTKSESGRAMIDRPALEYLRAEAPSHVAHLVDRRDAIWVVIHRHDREGAAVVALSWRRTLSKGGQA